MKRRVQDIFIFGVGRSGTTMLYSLCQKLLQEHSGDAVRFIYEPYIWSPVLFNRPYEECTELFGKTSSLSVDGIYHHVNTPMFMLSSPPADTMQGSFYHHFRTLPNDTVTLAKIIRGNGRLPLFRALNPTAKFVLVIRDPIDVVNSVKYKFSFYGDDFYPSDFPRFCTELTAMDRLTIEPQAAHWAERSAEYCYQMNRAGLEAAAQDNNTIVFDYDHFVSEKAASLRRLLDFLDIAGDYNLETHLTQPTGPTTPSIALSDNEFCSLMRYEQLYDELCCQYGIARGQATEQVLSRYEGHCMAADYDSRYDGFVPNRLRRTIWQLEDRLQQSFQKKHQVRRST